MALPQPLMVPLRVKAQSILLQEILLLMANSLHLQVTARLKEQLLLQVMVRLLLLLQVMVRLLLLLQVMVRLLLLLLQDMKPVLHHLLQPNTMPRELS
jgi:hypothetical protein